MEELIRILYRWLKPIGIVSGIAAVLSALVSLLLPEYFLSTAVITPINPHLMDRTSLFSVEGGETPVYLFGGKPELNRLVTLSTSRSLEEHLVNKFKLYEHYKIDTTDKLKGYWVSEELRSHFKTVKTPDGLLKIEVLDKDPNIAAQMANEIVTQLDTLNKLVIMEKKLGFTSLYAREAEVAQTHLETMRDSLIRAINNDPDDTVTAHVLERIIRKAVEEYNSATTIYKQHLSAINQPYSSVYIIESAVPAVKRTKPVRWLIVVSATLVTLATMMLMSVFIEKFKTFNFEDPMDD
jgi:hypothetical protein